MARASPGIAGMVHMRSGLASWYDGQHRFMADGCRFRADRATAASRTLPIGSWVQVRRGRHSIVVEITDRGPYTGARVLDLSRAAAKRLDMLAAGIVTVSIEPLSIQRALRCRRVG
jgi:rare lipoprotein A